MTTITEGALTFSFSSSGNSEKYDDWSFYRNKFGNVCGGSKAVDIIHIEESETWMIEIKDYRVHRRTKVIDLGDEVALKVRDTLAGLVAAKFNATDMIEKQFSKRAIAAKKVHVVLHLEQPRKHSKLFPRAIDPSKILLKLKQRLKAIDAHPKVVDQNSLKPNMSWTVTG